MRPQHVLPFLPPLILAVLLFLPMNAEAAGSLNIPISLSEHAGIARVNEPILQGIPLPGETGISFDGLEEAISASQMYSWMDFGDIPIDFEQESSCGAAMRSITGQYGWKYDGDWGLLTAFLRSGNEDFLTWGLAAVVQSVHLTHLPVVELRGKQGEAGKDGPGATLVSQTGAGLRCLSPMRSWEVPTTSSEPLPHQFRLSGAAPGRGIGSGPRLQNRFRLAAPAPGAFSFAPFPQEAVSGSAARRTK